LFCYEGESKPVVMEFSSPAQERGPISAHHMIWQEILLQLFGLSGDEGGEHKWVVPSAVSADSHKELTVRQIIQHFHQEKTADIFIP